MTPEATMNTPRDKLLKPSLSQPHTTKAPYSNEDTFLTALIGGTFAIIGMTAFNAWRLGRLGRDAVPLIIMLAAYLGLVWTLVQPEWGPAIQQAVKNYTGLPAVLIISRFISLTLCGLFIFLHRNEQRGADIMGLERPNGWIGGTLFCMAGITYDVYLCAILSSVLGTIGCI
jgi:hypothetical protein